VGGGVLMDEKKKLRLVELGGTLRAHYSNGDMETVVIDTLTDLMHYIWGMEPDTWDFETCLRTARDHFRYELHDADRRNR
jgi:hypothetical protein